MLVGGLVATGLIIMMINNTLWTNKWSNTLSTTSGKRRISIIKLQLRFLP